MSKLSKEERSKLASDFFPSPYANSEELKETIIQIIDPIYQMIPKDKKDDRAWIGDNPKLTLDFDKVHDAKMPEKGESESKVFKDVVDMFNGLQYNGSSLTMFNVYPSLNKVSISSSLFNIIFSPNILEGENGRNMHKAELESGAMLGDMFGWDGKKSGCIYTYGGEAGWEYAIKYALSRVLRNSRFIGIREDAKVICSVEGQFSKLCSTDWNGLGMNNLIQIPVLEDNTMDPDELEKTIKDLHEKGIPIAAIVCTVGSTDVNAFDPLEKAHELIEKYPNNPQKYGKTLLYADSVIGFSWAAFLGYDFDSNPLGFEEETLNHLKVNAKAMEGLKYADCASADFHKTGFCPYTSTAFVYKNAEEFESLMTRKPKGEENENAYAYLQERSPYNPMNYTLESSRSGQGSVAGWSTLKYFGKDGFRIIQGVQEERHIFLRNMIKNKYKNMVCVNPLNYGTVTLFRVYDDSVADAKEQYNKEFNDPASREELIKNNQFVQEVGDKLWHWYSTGVRIDGRYTPYMSYTTGFRPTSYNKDKSDKYAVIYALKIYPCNVHVDEEVLTYTLKVVDMAVKAVIEDRKNKK